ncbi:hypothetical protein KCU89_g2306, partial [Aureobasidium melanogenum]
SGGASSATQSAAHLSLSRFDGNCDPAATGPARDMIPGISNNIKNIDLGATMWTEARDARHAFSSRQPASKLGSEIEVHPNTFPVTGLPTEPVYQYQVRVGAGAEKRGLIRAFWDSKATKENTGQGWIFIGNVLAWSSQTRDDICYNVDLDKEASRAARSGRTNSHRVTIKPTAVINFTTLNAYLTGTATYDPSILQAITVLDRAPQARGQLAIHFQSRREPRWAAIQTGVNVINLSADPFIQSIHYNNKGSASRANQWIKTVNSHTIPATLLQTLALSPLRDLPAFLLRTHLSEIFYLCSPCFDIELSPLRDLLSFLFHTLWGFSGPLQTLALSPRRDLLSSPAIHQSSQAPPKNIGASAAIMRILARQDEPSFDTRRFESTKAYREDLPSAWSFRRSLEQTLEPEVRNFPWFRENTSVERMPDALQLSRGFYVPIGRSGDRLVLATFAFVLFQDRVIERYALRPTILITPFGRDGYRILDLRHQFVIASAPLQTHFSDQFRGPTLAISIRRMCLALEAFNPVETGRREECLAFTEFSELYADDENDETYDPEDEEAEDGDEAEDDE